MTQTNTVLLIGSGPMAVEYAKALKALNVTPVTVGRGAASAEKFTAETGLPASRGGIESWLREHKDNHPDRAIVTVGEKWLGVVTLQLIEHGFKEILVEKPGGHDADEIRAVATAAKKSGANVLVGYNRRFYASVVQAQRIIADDGGVTSFNFEFTEWGHVIAGIPKEEGVKEEWFLSNSTHLIDLAFYLGGKPQELSAFSSGSLAWHPLAAVFAGAGRSENGALFSYQANWAAPGRWGLEVLTSKHRLIFRPVEKLQIQKIGSVAIEPVEIDDTLDKDYKPGLYDQTRAFLNREAGRLPTIHDQVEMLDWYQRIRGDRG